MIKEKQFVEDYCNIFGKIPPQATQYEEAVLGAMLLEPVRCVEAISQMQPEYFYKEANKHIFEAVKELSKMNESIDVLTVFNYLSKKNMLEIAGGVYYLNTLCDKIAGAGNILSHVKIIKEKYILRQYIAFSMKISQMAYDNSVDVFDVQDLTETMLKEINLVVASENTMQHISNAIEKAIKDANNRAKQYESGVASGIDTGLPKLNKLTAGWQNTDLIVLAARPSMGKTALMLYLMLTAAKSGRSVCAYSLEMSDVSITNRMLLSMSQLDVYDFRVGRFTPNDWNELHKAACELSKLPIYIDDNPVVNMQYIKANSLVKKQNGKCDIIFIDYLQLVDTNKSKGKTREQEVAEASREAKIIAKLLNVPVILLAQLNRSVETRGGNKKPMLADLRESGAIEQDADIVAFLYRPEYYGFKNDENGNSTNGYGEIIISKNRNGGLDMVPFYYNQSMTKIYDESPVNDFTEVETSIIKPITNFYEPENNNEIPF